MTNKAGMIKVVIMPNLDHMIIKRNSKMEFKNWEGLMSSGNKELLDTELKFESMNRGVMGYSGEFKGKKVYCSVAECNVGDYDYSPIEKVSSVTQGEYVVLKIDEKEILNTY